MKMKNIIRLFLLLPFLGLTQSCSDDSEITNKTTENSDEYITVSLSPTNVGGDTRSGSTDDVYGINVYMDSDKDGVYEYNYSYGLFNDRSKMTVTLLKNYSYKFECTLIKDGMNTLYKGSGDLFYEPFKRGNNATYMNNEFVYKDVALFSGIKTGTSCLTSTSTVTYPQTDRYYGEVEGFFSNSTNTRVTIEMKHVVFGVKYVITGVEDGSVVVSCNDLHWSKTTRINHESDNLIYTYQDVYDCWKNEPDLDFNITVNYTSDRGTYWNFTKSKSVTFKRNVLTTVYINLEPDKSSVTFTDIEEPWDTDNNIDLGLNTNGMIDVVVDPNEEQ